MSSTFSPTFSADSNFNSTTSLIDVSAGSIVLNGVSVNTYTEPVTATGEFLSLNINGIQKYIKIWN